MTIQQPGDLLRFNRRVSGGGGSFTNQPINISGLDAAKRAIISANSKSEIGNKTNASASSAALSKHLASTPAI
jgi:hypothetical protein